MHFFLIPSFKFETARPLFLCFLSNSETESFFSSHQGRRRRGWGRRSRSRCRRGSPWKGRECLIGWSTLGRRWSSWVKSSCPIWQRWDFGNGRLGQALARMTEKVKLVNIECSTVCEREREREEQTESKKEWERERESKRQKDTERVFKKEWERVRKKWKNFATGKICNVCLS